MTRQEFEQRTGYYPSSDEYKVIEKFYMDYDGEKDQFCEAYKKNTDSIAQKIQLEIDVNRRLADEQLVEEKKQYESRIEKLEKDLERELEWKPTELSGNVSQEEYMDLANASGTREMTDGEAKDILYRWFGFAKEKVEVLRQVPQYEVNRHRLLRKVGSFERSPRYNATDWNYIRFDCGGMTWELHNGELRPYVH